MTTNVHWFATSSPSTPMSLPNGPTDHVSTIPITYAIMPTKYATAAAMPIGRRLGSFLASRSYLSKLIFRKMMCLLNRITKSCVDQYSNRLRMQVHAELLPSIDSETYHT